MDTMIYSNNGSTFVGRRPFVDKAGRVELGAAMKKAKQVGYMHQQQKIGGEWLNVLVFFNEATPDSSHVRDLGFGRGRPCPAALHLL